jgi:hypothetical protein
VAAGQGTPQAMAELTPEHLDEQQQDKSVSSQLLVATAAGGTLRKAGDPRYTVIDL